MVILRKTISRKTGIASARIKEWTRHLRIEEKTARMKRQSGRVRMWRMRRFSVPSQPSWRDIDAKNQQKPHMEKKEQIPTMMKAACLKVYLIILYEP